MTPKHWITLGGLMGVHLLIDALLPPAMEAAQSSDEWAMVGVFTLLGICASQVNLIAVWAVFAPGAVAWRLPWAMLLGMVMWCVLMMSNQLTWGFEREEALVLGGVLFSGIMLAQIPLWILRACLRYRLYPPGGRDRDDGQFSMKHLLIGIALCCVGLAFIQAVLPPPSNRGAGEIWGIVFTVTLVAVTNLLLTLPCMWLGLTRSQGVFALWLPAYAGYAVLVCLLECFILYLITGDLPGWTEGISLAAFNLMQGASIGSTLAILRASGFTWESDDARAKIVTAVIVEMAQPETPAEPARQMHPLDAP